MKIWYTAPKADPVGTVYSIVFDWPLLSSDPLVFHRVGSRVTPTTRVELLGYDAGPSGLSYVRLWLTDLRSFCTSGTIYGFDYFVIDRMKQRSLSLIFAGILNLEINKTMYESIVCPVLHLLMALSLLRR